MNEPMKVLLSKNNHCKFETFINQGEGEGEGEGERHCQYMRPREIVTNVGNTNSL